MIAEISTVGWRLPSEDKMAGMDMLCFAVDDYSSTGDRQKC